MQSSKTTTVSIHSFIINFWRAEHAETKKHRRTPGNNKSTNQVAAIRPLGSKTNQWWIGEGHTAVSCVHHLSTLCPVQLKFGVWCNMVLFHRINTHTHAHTSNMVWLHQPWAWGACRLDINVSQRVVTRNAVCVQSKTAGIDQEKCSFKRTLIEWTSIEERYVKGQKTYLVGRRMNAIGVALIHI